MAKQTVKQTYTYYEPDGAVRVVHDEPLQGRGKAWIDGSYKPPVYPSPINVRVGERGIRVATVIQWLRLYDDDIERVVTVNAPSLTREDVEAALAYYKTHQDEIDRKIEEQHASE